MFRSGRVIQNRLDKLQLDRVETAADGSCQFVALTLSAGIALDAFAFRTQVVGYLRSTATFFKNDIDRSFPSFESSGYHEFGGHVGRRPDASGRIPPPNPRRERPRHGERTLFCPPAIISQEIYGSDIVICHVMQNHYEATRPRGRGAKREP